jgi:enolase
MSDAIAGVAARRVWDSRGRPTLEVEVRLASGASGTRDRAGRRFAGSREAIDLRDGGTRFAGGWTSPRRPPTSEGPDLEALAGRDASDQAGIDAALVALDGSPNKARLGGNATVAVSIAVAQAAAAARAMPLWRYLAGDAPVSLPMPEIQIFGGGAHAGRRIDVQDLMIDSGRRGFLRRGARDDRRDLSRGRRADARPRFARRRRRRGWLVARLRQQREGAGDARSRPSSAQGCTRATTPPSRSTSPRRIRPRRPLSARARPPRARSRRHDRAPARLARSLPIVSVEDPLAEDDRDGWVAFAARPRRASRSSATTI